MRVVIPSRLGGVMLDELLLALEGEGVSPKDVLVVRDGGDEWMESRLCPDPQGPTRRMGFAGAADWGIRHADAREVLLLNDDLLPEEGLIEGLNQIRDKAPFIGCRLLNFEGTVVEFDGGGMNALGFALSLGCGERPTEKRGGETLFASGAAVLLNAQAYSSVGGYATGFFAYFEDMELGWRAHRLGFPTWIERGLAVRHRGQVTSGSESGFRERMMERNALLALALNSPSHLVPALLGIAWRFSRERERRSRERGWMWGAEGASYGRRIFAKKWPVVRSLRERFPPREEDLKRIAPLLVQPKNPAFLERLDGDLLAEAWDLWQ